jgi:hypothetical protein
MINKPELSLDGAKKKSSKAGRIDASHFLFFFLLAKYFQIRWYKVKKLRTLLKLNI